LIENIRSVIIFPPLHPVKEIYMEEFSVCAHHPIAQMQSPAELLQFLTMTHSRLAIDSFCLRLVYVLCRSPIATIPLLQDQNHAGYRGKRMSWDI